MNNARKISAFGALAWLASVAACSDAVPPSPQGAVSVHLGSSMMGQCNKAAHWINAPPPSDASMLNTQQVTTGSKGTLAVDGEGGAHVSCTVHPNGGKFEIIANIVAPVPNKFSTNVSIHTTLGADDQTAGGTLIAADDQNAGNPYTAPSSTVQGSQCTFQTNGGASGIAAGKVWGTVSCVGATDTSDIGSVCDFTPAGAFVFENCGQ
jgi:hypothetical protein